MGLFTKKVKKFNFSNYSFLMFQAKNRFFSYSYRITLFFFNFGIEYIPFYIKKYLKYKLGSIFHRFIDYNGYNQNSDFWTVFFNFFSSKKGHVEKNLILSDTTFHGLLEIYF